MIPTLYRIIAAIDPVALDAAISDWITRQTKAGTTAATGTGTGLKAVAVDGKEVRGAKHGGGTKTMLRAGLDHGTGTVIALRIRWGQEQ